MAIEFVIGIEEADENATDVTTDAIDTTGANFLVAAVASTGSAFTVTDSKGNTWVELTPVASTQVTDVQLVYALNATCGASHTFTVDCDTDQDAAIWVGAFSGVAAASAFDDESGTDGTTGPISPGSITPAEDNELFIVGLGANTAGGTTFAIDDGFTIMAQEPEGNDWGGLLAYKIQTSAAAENPEISVTAGSTTGLACAMAAFKAAAVGGGSTQPPRSMHQFRLRAA